MKRVKRIFLLIIVIALIVPAFQSCGKYDDGPFFSIRTKTMRLTAEWEVDEIDGESPDGYDVFLEFEKGGDFTQTVDDGSDKFKVKATWTWGAGKTSIDIEPDDSDLYEDFSFDILRLTKDELWLEDEDGDEWIPNKVK